MIAFEVSQFSTQSDNCLNGFTEFHAYKLLVVSILICCFSPISVAHTDLTDRIDILSHKIEQNPDYLKLHMERGRVFRLRGDLQNALKDFQIAKKLAFDNIEVRYELGLVLLKMSDFTQALSQFNYVLKVDPKYPLVLINRARVFRGMRDYANAATDYRRALKFMPSPNPEDYIETADNYVDYGDSHYGNALVVLDAAMVKLGVLVQLQSRAIDIDLLLHNYQSALRRVDLLLVTMKRKEKWLVTKAEILLSINKPKEAIDNYRLALRLIVQLPAVRRNVDAIKDLEMNIRKSLLDLNSGLGEK